MSLYLKRKELSSYSVNIPKFHLIHQTLSRRHPPVLQPPVEIFYLIANERHTARLPKIPYFPPNRNLIPNTAFSEPLFLHKYTVIVYLYIFTTCHDHQKQDLPTVCAQPLSLRVNKYRAECSQPIGMIVNNRRSECSHGEWRLCTNGNDTDFTALPHLYEYAELSYFGEYWIHETEKSGDAEFVTSGC